MRDIAYITSSLLAGLAVTVIFTRALLLAVMTGIRHLCKEKVINPGKGYCSDGSKASRNRNACYPLTCAKENVRSGDERGGKAGGWVWCMRSEIKSHL
jgi:hypothetical protein